jgi:hypothetical protein
VDYQQEPSLTDIRAIRDDQELQYAQYEGEYVISNDFVYLIRRDGTVETVGATLQLLQNQA